LLRDVGVLAGLARFSVGRSVGKIDASGELCVATTAGGGKVSGLIPSREISPVSKAQAANVAPVERMQMHRAARRMTKSLASQSIERCNSRTRRLAAASQRLIAVGA
jgi:hypothetical protein